MGEWQSELVWLASKPQPGLCVPHSLTTGSVNLKIDCQLENCCQSGPIESNLCFIFQPKQEQHFAITDTSSKQSSICYLHRDISTSNLAPYYRSLSPAAHAKQHKACLPARTVIESVTQFCNHTSDCMDTYFGTYSCLYPYSPDPGTRLITINVANKPKAILFWGPPAEVFHSVAITDMRPQFRFIPLTALQSTNKFLWQVASIFFQVFLIFNFISLGIYSQCLSASSFST